MKIALIEPYVTVDSLKSYAEKTEPSHFLGMYNLLKKAECDVVINDAYSKRLYVDALIEWLVQGSFTHAGFTVYDYSPCLSYISELFALMPPSIYTIVGGPGATYCTERMIEMLKPDLLVKGQGESAMVELFESGFDSYTAAYEMTKYGKTTVVSYAPMVLNEIPYERPYSLDIYNHIASPRIQSGCVGKCVFCSGAYQKKFDYISGKKAEEMFEYLIREKHAEIIAPNGSDFTAVPAKANEIVGAIIKGNLSFREFRPGVRLDTLSRAIQLNPSIWMQFSSRYTVKMESSIESFSEARLLRLGKNLPTDFMEGLYSSLKKIFANCRCSIVLGRIAIDPTITIDEFILDCEGFRKLLNEFSRDITVGGMLINKFVPLQGTPATEENGPDNPWIRTQMADPSMLKLEEALLENNKFKYWCRLAENLNDFSERNMVFDEILRVAAEYAKEIKLACTV